MITHIVVISAILIVSIAAYRFQSLSISGAIAAMLVGIAVYLGFNIEGLIVLGSFFGTSSLWSSYKSQQKKQLEEKLEKGSKRDWIQVFANGGISALCSIFYFLSNDLIWAIAFLTSVASATGDTWSSEIGPLSRRLPLSVKSFKRVEAGTSGAISIIGTLSAILGVGFITTVGLILLPISIKMGWIIFTFGILGNGIDTFLGAYYQRSFHCEVCCLETEKTVHCGKTTKRINGFLFINNDIVNLLSSLLAPILAMLTYHLVL